MKLRIVSWNLNGFGSQLGRIEFLRSLKPDVVILLEVTSRFCQTLKQQKYLTNMACSLDLCTGELRRKRALGCVIGSPQLSLTGVTLLPEMPVAERALLARVLVGDREIDICGFHAPPGVNWGSMKSEAYAALSKWLMNRIGPTILGMDGNSPKVDHPDHSKSEFWRPNEDLVLGAKAKHRLGDSYRIFLEKNPDLMDKMRSDRPDGPMALSYDRGKKTSVPSRYDFIFASPEFQIHKADYPYSESIKAGSDHSAVVVDLEL